MADEVLHSGVRGVTDLMVKPGMINLDFADIRTVMREMGKAMMGTGEATGERRAIEAAEAAISNPLLDDVSLKGARALLINITGGSDMTLFEVDEAANRIREEVDSEANIIFGSTFSDAMDGRMRVSVVATGIDVQPHTQAGGTQKFSASTTSSSSEPKKPFAFGSSLAPKAEIPKPVARVHSHEIIRDHVAAAQPQPQPIVQPQTAQAPVRPLVEQRAPVRTERAYETQAASESSAPRVRISDYEEDEVEHAQEVRSVVREQQAVAREQVGATQELFAEQRQVASGGTSLRHEPREMPRDNTKGFFQRMADVGRSLSTRHEESTPKQNVQERVHVVQKPASEVTEKAHKQAEDDQYLDIPAFLRRQAN